MSLQITFLGTGGAVPTTQRSTSAVLCRREGERLLFDCGEGTQRQMMRFGTGFGIDHIFITHIHGDHVFGLPGLLQTMEFNDRDDPIAIHAPAGTRSAMERLVAPTGNRLSYPIRITQLSGVDVALDAEEYEIRAFETEHDTRSLGYALIENDRKGRFDRERAEELGVPVGPKFSRLHDGEPVEAEDETTVRPEQVVGEPRPGRRIVYTGDTRPTEATAAAAEDADLLIHDATFAADRADRAKRTAHSTAAEAARIGNRAGASRLALLHVSSRYAGDVSPIKREAADVFDGESFVPDDGDSIEVPYPEP